MVSNRNHISAFVFLTEAFVEFEALLTKIVNGKMRPI
jgi:hypothetical protein